MRKTESMSDKYILDTSALIELLTETEKGSRVLGIIKNASTLIPSIVVAELRSKLERTGIQSDEFIKGIQETSHILDLNFQIADKAGKKHAELRKKFEDISLADCIIMSHAENEQIKVITTDSHFKNSNAILL